MRLEVRAGGKNMIWEMLTNLKMVTDPYYSLQNVQNDKNTCSFSISCLLKALYT